MQVSNVHSIGIFTQAKTDATSSHHFIEFGVFAGGVGVMVWCRVC